MTGSPVGSGAGSGTGGGGDSASVRAVGGPDHPAPSRGLVSPAVLWFGLFGGPGAWSILLIANYAIASHACYPRLVPLMEPVSGQRAFLTPLIGISIVAIVIGAAALVFAIAAWRQCSGETGGETHWLLDTGEGRTRFMAAAGIMTSSVFLLDILIHGAVVLLLGHC